MYIKNMKILRVYIRRRKGVLRIYPLRIFIFFIGGVFFIRGQDYENGDDNGMATRVRSAKPNQFQRVDYTVAPLQLSMSREVHRPST